MVAFQSVLESLAVLLPVGLLQLPATLNRHRPTANSRHCVADLVGNQAVGSWMFEMAASALVRKLNSGPIQAINSGEY